MFIDDVTPEIRKEVSEKIAALRASASWDEKTVIGEAIDEAMRDDPDFYKSVLSVFAAYFSEDKDAGGFSDDLPWREVLDRMLVAMCGYSFLSIARHGLKEAVGPVSNPFQNRIAYYEAEKGVEECES